MTTSFPPISYPSKPVPPFSAPAPRNPFPGFYPDMWRNISGKPYITVSSKGLANGLSEYFNDGADFGPDSLQADGSLTQSSGIQEAWNYAVSVAINYNLTLSSIIASPSYFIPEIRLLPGAFIIKKGITFSASHVIQNFKLIGESSMSPYIVVTTNDGLFTFDANTFAAENIEIDNITPVTASGYTPAYVVKADFSSVSQTNTFQTYNLDTNGEFQAGLILNNFIQANLYNYQTYCPIGDQFTNVGTINYFGGQLGGATGTSGVTPHTYSGTITNLAFYAVNNILPISFSSTGIGHISIYDSAVQNITLTGTTCYINIYNCLNAPGQVSPLINSTVFSVIELLTIRGLNVDVSDIYLNDTTLLVVTEIDIKGLYPVDTPIPVLTPSISANPPVSGTVYQNTNQYEIEIDLPVYATTSGTAGYVTIAKGSTDTPTAIGNQYVSGDTSSTATQIIRVRVPAGWYYSFTGSGVTFATATPFAE